jgi:ferredoxin
MEIDEKLCDICGACVAVCPVDAISVSEFRVSIDPATCIHCGNCRIVCPAKAIFSREEVQNETA